MNLKIARMCKFYYLTGIIMIQDQNDHKQRGAVGARRAHNPEVGGSKPFAARNIFVFVDSSIFIKNGIIPLAPI